MENELTTLQLRLERATRDIDREVGRIEAARGKRSSMFRSRLRGSSFRIDPGILIKPRNPRIDPDFVITRDEMRRRKKLIAERHRAGKELVSLERVLPKMRDLEARIDRGIDGLKKRRAEIEREMSASATTPEKRARLLRERQRTEKTLGEKREALSSAMKTIQESKRRIRKLRKDIQEIDRQFPFLFQA